MQRPFRGFTLFELMAVVAVVAVVATAAVANMSEQIAEARAHADGQAMMQRIRLEHRNSKERMRGLVLKSTG
ncbi:MAG TPA: prepilin-type N-terminal cleavage/methylation domain-containing protein, partial [Myxococcota bacterium]